MQEPATDAGTPALEPLAIVGAGCRLPGGVHSPEDYWALLSEGRDAITDGPPEEWRREALDHPDAYPFGGFLDSIDGFDWRAFHTSPREARFMDPQQRLALEVAWEAFEHAGMTMESLAGRRAAVAVGIMWPDYAKLQARDMGRLDGYTVTGSGFAYAANRISAFFDLLGPSFSLDVMCASSLAAVHLACQSIWSGEVDMALAAGVNLILSPDTNVAMTKARILSPDGRCKTLDERANGFVRGEGAAAIVIKPASRAAADGDRVIALIRGTAFNHSGRNEWIMAPSREAQAAVIAEACRRAGVEPAELDMVEMHGTGTEKGDPIEAAALGDTVGAGRDPSQPCRVGSVKTNIGHLDSAAGIAGLLKAALSLHHGKVPPSLHFQSPNPAIDLDSLGLAVQTELGDWPHADERRLAGVTALAFGAANAHAVLEGPPALEPAEPIRERPLIVPVSAESDAALGELLADHAALLRNAHATSLEDIAFTATRRRTHRAARAAAVGSTGQELAERLEEAARAVAKRSGRRAGKPCDPVFVFSGQNCSWAGMGRGLLAAEPAFAAKLDECDAVVSERAGWSLREAIEQGDETLAAAGPPSRVQPALCALQIALAALWRSWGVEPLAVVGHSVGEIAAACVAGALDVEQAMRLALERGTVMESLHGRGRTAAVALSADAVADRLAPLGGAVWIAGVNAPEATVVAGEPEQVEQLVRDLEADRVQATLLGVHSAFHGVGSASLGEELEGRLGFLEPAAFAIPMVSTLTGEQLTEGEPAAGYWARQMSCPVLFRDAAARLIEDGQTRFVEIAPHSVLRSALATNLRAAEADGAVVASMRRDRDERAEMLTGLARLYELGHAIDWANVHERDGRVVALPRYRWQHERLWLDPPAEEPAGDAGGHPLLGRHVELAHAAGSHLWEGTLDPKRLPYLLEHRIDELAVLPGSGYVELAVAAVERAAGWMSCELQDLRFERALVLDADKPTRIQTLLQPAGDAFRFSVHSAAAGGWTRHVSALVAPLDETAEQASPPAPPEAPVLEPDECYAGFTRQGVDYGPAFRGIARAWTSDDGLLAELEAPQSIANELPAYRHHPAVLDAWMHVVALAGGTGAAGFMPTGIPSLRIHGPGTRRAWSSVTLRGRESGAVTGDITVVDEQGRTVMEARGLRLRQLGSAGEAIDPERRYELRWQDAPEVDAARPLTGSWLVLTDSGGVGERAAEMLRERGAGATLVAAGEPLPSERSFDGVLHLRGLDTASGLPRDDAAVEDAVRLSATSLLELSRTLEAGPVWIVTRGAQAVDGDDAPAPLAAMSWGLGRTLQQERPALFGGLVDLDPAADAEELIDCLERSGREDQLAVRDGRVLVARLTESDTAPEGDLTELRADSAYLVTGGLGGLGGATARWLAERGAGHLVLVSRSGLRDESQAALVRDLEALGATVHVAAADVAAPGALQTAIDTLRADGLPPIRGAVHAAGVPGFDSLDEMSDEALRSVLAAKVEGTIALHRALEPEPLDFFTMFSSIAALLSSPRMGHYAAGNAFQGALAAHRRSLGLPAQALYWGVWGEVGMAVGTDGGPRTLRGHRSLSTAEGLRLLAGAAREPERDVALFEMDWAEWRSFYPRSAGAPLLELIADAKAPAEPESRSTPERRFEPAATNGSAPATSSPLADRIVATVAETLRLPAVDPDDSLADLGFDSLMAAELRVRIEDEHGVRIPLLRMLEATSVRALAETVAAGAGGDSLDDAEPPEESPSTELVPADRPRVPAVRSPAQLELDIIDELMLALKDDRAPASIHCELRVEGRIDADRLEEAIREAARAHPVTRGTLAPARPLRDTRLRWNVSDELHDVPLEVVECEDESELELARERLLSDTPPLDRGTFTMLLAHAPHGDAIVLNVHHAAGDGVAAFRFMTSIARAYAGEADTVPDVDHATARDVHTLIGRSLRSRAKRLRGLPDSLRRLVKPPARLALPGAGDRRGYGFDLFTLTPDEVERMLGRAPRGATLNDVMLGALAVTVRRWNERHGKKTGDVHVMYPVNVRPPGWSFDVFGNFAPWTAVRVTPKEQAGVGSAAEAATWRTRKIRENGIAGLFMDVIELPHYLPVGIARHGPKLFAPRLAVDTTLLSNIGQVSNLPARLGDAGAVKTFWGTPPGYPRMETSFSAAVFRSQLFVGLRYSRSGFDRETAHELALLYRETLLGGSPDPKHELVMAGHDEQGGV